MKAMILPAILGIALLAALGECNHGESGTELKMSKDANKLSKLITLSHRPEEVSWETVELGGSGSNDWALIAVIRFPPGVVDEMIAGSRLLAGESAPTLQKSMVFDWYPGELKAMLVPDSFDTYHVSGKIYDPSSFARSPLMSGYVTRIGSTDQLFVYLYTT